MYFGSDFFTGNQIECGCLDIWNSHWQVCLWQEPFPFLPVKCKDWEEVWLDSGTESAFISQGTEQQLLSSLRPPITMILLLDGHSLPPPCAIPLPLFSPRTAESCYSMQLCCGASSVRGRPRTPGKMRVSSVWRAISDSWWVDGAAEGQHQTGGRWRGQWEGNTTLYLTLITLVGILDGF